jgi:hypothetical protein
MNGTRGLWVGMTIERTSNGNGNGLDWEKSTFPPIAVKRCDEWGTRGFVGGVEENRQRQEQEQRQEQRQRQEQPQVLRLRCSR